MVNESLGADIRVLAALQAMPGSASLHCCKNHPVWQKEWTQVCGSR